MTAVGNDYDGLNGVLLCCFGVLANEWVRTEHYKMIKYQNKHLQQKYESDSSFRQRAHEEEQNYQLLLQKADAADSLLELDPSILEQFPYP